MDYRLWIFLFISIFFWLFYLPIQRRGRFNSENAIRVCRQLAWLAGSLNTEVNWKALSFQLGFATFFLWHALLVWLNVKQFMLWGGGLTMLSLVVIQMYLKQQRHRKRSN